MRAVHLDTRSGHLAVAATGLAAVLALWSGVGTPAAASAPAAAAAGTEFHAAKVPHLGTVLVDARGRTVYVLTANGRTNVPCSDGSGCTTIWPALALPQGVGAAEAGRGARASLLGTKKLSDGRTYPTYKGWLLYEYVGDGEPGRATGEGLRSFGGTWYVLAPAGTPVTSTAGGSSRTPANRGTGGYSGRGAGGIYDMGGDVPAGG